MTAHRGKEAPSGSSGGEGRGKQSYSREKLSEIVQRLRGQATELAAVVKAAEQAGIDEIWLGDKMLKRGIEAIDGVIDNATVGVSRARCAKQSKE